MNQIDDLDNFECKEEIIYTEGEQIEPNSDPHDLDMTNSVSGINNE